FRRASRRFRPLSAARRARGDHPCGRARLRAGRMECWRHRPCSACRARCERQEQYPADRRTALHALHLPLRSGGHRPSRRDDRRDRAHASPARRNPQSENRYPEPPPSGRSDAACGSGCRAGDGTVISVGHYLAVSAVLFTLGVLGIFINRKNIIVILMAIELILLAVNINLVAFSAALGDLVGQVFAMFVLTVAAGEAAIGLAILVIYFRGRGTIAVDDANRMKG